MIALPFSYTVKCDRSQLVALLDDLSDDLVAEVRDFAEFLRLKHQQKSAS